MCGWATQIDFIYFIVPKIDKKESIPFSCLFKIPFYTNQILYNKSIMI